MSLERLVNHAEKIMRRMEKDCDHVLHVARQAVKMAMGMGERLEAPERSLGILEAAALLHDIGWERRPDGRGHHKASEEMIMGEEWPDELREWVPCVAAVARYHRKRGPRVDDRVYGGLSKRDKKCVGLMAGILRLADSLDREHRQLYEVERLDVRDGQWVKVYVNGPSGSSWDIVEEGWRKKRDVAEVFWGMVWEVGRVDVS